MAAQNAKPLDAAVIVIFPADVFSAEELEAVNPSVSREDVRMRLAYRVSRREVQFSPASERDKLPPLPAGEERPVRFVYWVAGDSGARLGTASHKRALEKGGDGECFQVAAPCGQ